MRDRGDPSSTIKPIATMMNHATTEVFFDDLELPADALIGEEGKGFRYILDGMNAERILIAGGVHRRRPLLHRPRRRLRQRAGRLRPADRRQPGRPVPARARPHGRSQAADLMRWKAAALYERRRPLRGGGEHGQVPRLGGLLGGGQRGLDTHGGFGFAAEYDIERKFRETRLYQIGADQQQPGAGVRRPARARPAALLLMAVELDPGAAAPLRSLLFAGATRPDLVAKLPRAGADAVIVDLEDSVPEDRKEAARAALPELVASAAGARVMVRINGSATPWHEADLAAAAALPLAGVLQPMVERAEELAATRGAAARGGAARRRARVGARG